MIYTMSGAQLTALVKLDRHVRGKIDYPKIYSPTLLALERRGFIRRTSMNTYVVTQLGRMILELIAEEF